VVLDGAPVAPVEPLPVSVAPSTAAVAPGREVVGAETVSVAPERVVLGLRAVVVAPGRVAPVKRVLVVVPGAVVVVTGAVLVVVPGSVLVVVPGSVVVVAAAVVLVAAAVVVVTAHVGLMIVSLINDTWPVRASRRPSTTAPLFTEILALAMTVPTKWVVVSMVAEVPTCQKMSHAEALLSRTTLDPGAVVSVLPIWKM
jgi:hypothetical protein